MSKWIPERPTYRRERLIVGYPLLGVFAILFLCSVLFDLLDLPANAYFLKLLPIAAILLPVTLFWTVRGAAYTRVMRLRAPRAAHVPFLLSALLVLISGGLLLSMLFGGTETLGNSAVAFEKASPNGPLDTILALLVLAILPAITEELLFRGIAIAEYERRGSIRAVLMSALTFSLCHFDLRNLAVYFFSGVILALVLFATDSLFATMAIHLCYNVFSLFGQQYLNAFYRITGGPELFVFSLLVILLLFLVIFFGTAARIYRLKDLGGRREPRRNVPTDVQFYTTLDALKDPPILLCFILSIAGFILL